MTKFILCALAWRLPFSWTYTYFNQGDPWIIVSGAGFGALRFSGMFSVSSNRPDNGGLAVKNDHRMPLQENTGRLLFWNPFLEISSVSLDEQVRRHFHQWELYLLTTVLPILFYHSAFLWIIVTNALQSIQRYPWKNCIYNDSVRF